MPKRRLKSSEKVYVDEKVCIQAEDFIRKTMKMLEHWPMWDTSEILNKTGFFELIEHLYQEHVTKDRNGAMADHLYIVQLSRRILTHSEYEIVFNSHPSLNARWKDRLWRHMTHCLVFFINTYREILDAIKSIKDDENEPYEILNLLKWILKILRIMDTSRRNFPFCEECDFRSGKRCKFWSEVYSEIRGSLCLPDEKARIKAIQAYFQALEILCKCPRSIENLKKL
ncbi:MAG: hypothetical protein ACFFD2_01895 [Promethearchaeota archaeon]